MEWPWVGEVLEGAVSGLSSLLYSLFIPCLFVFASLLFFFLYQACRTKLKVQMFLFMTWVC